MSISQLLRWSVAFVAVAACSAIPAAAQLTRTWVSGLGDDANPCSRTAPCKTWAGALAKTAVGGEISALDPGGFGTAVINRAVTINGDGTLAGVTSGGASGFIVNAGRGAEVVIRNVSIQGAGSGISGVRYLSGAHLTLERVTITGFHARENPGWAVDVSLSGAGALLMSDVTITNCEAGVRVAGATATVQATLDNVRIANTSTHAVEALANSVVTVKHSTLSGNFNAGVRAAASGAVIHVEDSVLSFNNAGANAAVAGALIRLSNTAVLDNITGIAIAPGATVESAGNNRVAGNGSSTPPNGVINVE